MNYQEHLLKITEEECNELAQAALRTAIRISKAMRFSLNEIQPEQALNNADRIVEEFNDIVAMMEMLQEAGYVPTPFIKRDLIDAKKLKVMEFLKLSKKQGTLEAPKK